MGEGAYIIQEKRKSNTSCSVIVVGWAFSWSAMSVIEKNETGRSSLMRIRGNERNSAQEIGIYQQGKGIWRRREGEKQGEERRQVPDNRFRRALSDNPSISSCAFTLYLSPAISKSSGWTGITNSFILMYNYLGCKLYGRFVDSCAVVAIPRNERQFFFWIIQIFPNR